VPIGRQLAKLMAALKPGDMVTVTKLDRLGRSTRAKQIREVAQVIRRSLGTETLCYCPQPTSWYARSAKDVRVTKLSK
jgi:hypothetical protein